MTASEFIDRYRNFANKGNLSELDELISFKELQSEPNNLTDINLDFRTAVVEQLFDDFSLADIGLIRKLFHEEQACESAIGRHDNLYQLCFYLFTLGQLKDTFILYDAKFNATNMDVGMMLDRESITVGHEVEEVIEYVQNEFLKTPTLRQRYPKILDELLFIKDRPDYDNIASYGKFIKGYFYGHENVISENSHCELNLKDSKPWWKFW
ncbi:MAG: hypothetical protein ACXVAY_04045 [Mucilaginibacter sp.]